MVVEVEVEVAAAVEVEVDDSELATVINEDTCSERFIDAESMWKIFYKCTTVHRSMRR